MPAGITRKDGQDLVAVNWSRGNPWHMLGHRVAKDMTIDDALGLVKGNDVVVPATLYTRNDDGSYEEVEGKVGIKSSVFGTMATASPDYEITQRREILELAFEIEGLGKGEARVDTIGNIGDKAQKFFAYIRVPDLVIDPEGVCDTIERGLFVLTSFDGSHPNMIGQSDIRPVCENTVQMALRAGLGQQIKARHTLNSEQRMRQAAEALEYAGAVEQAKIAQAYKMLGVDGDKAIDTLLDTMWPMPDDLPSSTRTRRDGERGTVRSLYEAPGNTTSELVGRNGWAAYNAVTEFFDHKRPVRGDLNGTRRAESAILPGKIVNEKIKASEIVLSLA